MRARKCLITGCAFFLLACGGMSAGRVRLFSDEARMQQPSVVYTFLERYAFELDSLQKKYGDAKVAMDFDHFSFRRGSLRDLLNLKPGDPYEIRLENGNTYEVDWLDDNGNVRVGVSFPASFELLYGHKRSEMEDAFRTLLKSQPSDFAPRTDIPANLIDVEGGCLADADTHTHYIPELNTTTYYTLDNGKHIPVCEKSLPAYSALNLFQGMREVDPSCKLHVSQRLAEYKRQDFEIGLGQWLNYCASPGMMTFSGVLEESADSVKLLLVVIDLQAGYQHLMSVSVPTELIDNPATTLNATLDAYIPTHHIEDLYSDRTKALKMKAWKESLPSSDNQ